MYMLSCKMYVASGMSFVKDFICNIHLAICNNTLPKRTIFTLFSNHMDAWQVALIAATLPLLVHGAISGHTAVLVLAIGVGYWLAFALNDYFDAPFDKVDPQKAMKNFFVQAVLKDRYLRPFFLFVVLFLFVTFISFGINGVLLFAICCAIMWAYSAPPIRLKSRPGLDLLTHAFFVQTFPYFICLSLIGAKWIELDYVLLAIFFLASLTAQLEQQLRDYAVDRQQEHTFATRTGLRSTLLLLKLITAVCIILAVVNILNGTIPWFILPFGLIGLPALTHRFLRKKDKPRSERLVIASTTVGFLYTGVIFIYFLLT